MAYQLFTWLAFEEPSSTLWISNFVQLCDCFYRALAYACWLPPAIFYTIICTFALLFLPCSCMSIFLSLCISFVKQLYMICLQDYGIDFEDHDHPVKAFQCKCGSKFCRNINSSSSKYFSLLQGMNDVFL